MTSIEQKRKWFREKFDYMADDATVESVWEKHNGDKK